MTGSGVPLGGGAWRHAALSVRDMERSLAFYRDVLGFTVAWDLDHAAGPVVDRIVGLEDVDVRIVLLAGYGAQLELFQYYRPRGEDRGPRRQCDFGLTHICLFVDDPRAEYDRLAEMGVEFISPAPEPPPGRMGDLHARPGRRGGGTRQPGPHGLTTVRAGPEKRFSPVSQIRRAANPCHVV